MTPETAGLVNGVERNLGAWLTSSATVPGSQAHSSSRIIWAGFPLSGWDNAATRIRLTPGTATAVIKRIQAEHRRRKAGTVMWVSPLSTPPDLPLRLRKFGFRCQKHFPAMTCDLRRPTAKLPHPAGLDIRGVEDYGDFRARRLIHPVLGNISTDLRREALRKVEARLAEKPRRTWEFLAWLDGKPVGCTTLFSAAGVAGIYDVAVLSSHWRRGIGAAVLSVALAFARKRGLRTAMLIASGMGEGLYRRVGFTETCRLSCWYSKQPSAD